VELRPGGGTLGLELGFLNPEGLDNLLQCKPGEINPAAVEKELIPHSTGIRLLMASYQPRATESLNLTDNFQAILNALPAISPLSIVDLGPNYLPGFDQMVDQFNEIILILDAHPISATKAKLLMDDLARKGFGKGKYMPIVVVNRLRTDVQMSWSQIADTLGTPSSVIFTPAPELAYQGSIRNIPMMLIQPESLSTQQFQKLAELISQHAKKS
jgi:Flp pilus assembly CpaE family ATPase